MVKKIGLVLVIALIGFLIAVSMQPSEFQVSRTARFAATPAAIFPHVNTLRKWSTWDPWAKMDPNCKTSFEGPVAGKGAVMRWAGNSKVGEGSMTITDSQPNQRVGLLLNFLKPMKATSIAEFSFKPEGKQTVVTWRMSGHNNFIGKAIGLVMNCEKMVGGQFEQGLANLKSVVEGSGKK